MKAYFAPKISAMVAGNASNELAKIGGMTPPELTRSGKYEDWPPMTRRPTTRLAYCTGMRRWPPSTRTMKATTATINASKQNDGQRSEDAPSAGLELFVEINDRARQANHDADKDDQRHAIADAAFADLFTEPHDERRAGGQGQHGHQA